MSAALLSFISGWWAWLIGRREPAHPPRAEFSPAGGPDGPPPPTEPDAAAPTGFAGRSSQSTGFTQPFLEMVRLQVMPVAAPLVVPVDAKVREQTLSALGGLRQIPALQSLAQGFIRATTRAEVSIDEVVETIEKDPALCVRVLRMANSAFVNSAQPIDDLSTAVQMLGVERVGTMAEALFTLREANRVVEGFDWRHLWIHAYATAAIAEELQRHVRTSSGAHLYLAALLHDVGKIVLSTVVSEGYRDVLVAAWNDHGQLEDLERARLGVDHREAGAVFARQNQLPAVVAEAIAHHAHPEAAQTHRVDVALVAVANHLTKTYGLGFSGSRLDQDAADFAALPFWNVVEEECGSLPDLAALEAEMINFIATLRPELRNLRTGD